MKNLIIKSIVFLLSFAICLFPNSAHAKGKYLSTQAGVTSAINDCAKKILVPANANYTQKWNLIMKNGILDSVMLTRAVESYSFYKNRIASCVSALNPTFECGDTPVGKVCAWSRDNPSGLVMDILIQKSFAGLKNKNWCIAAGYSVVPLRGLDTFCALPASTWG